MRAARGGLGVLWAIGILTTGVASVTLMTGVQAAEPSFDVDLFAYEGAPNCEGPGAEATITVQNNDTVYHYKIEVNGVATNSGGSSSCPTESSCFSPRTPCEINLNKRIFDVAPSSTSGVGGQMPLVDGSGAANTCHNTCSNCDNSECDPPDFCVTFDGSVTGSILAHSTDGTNWTYPIPVNDLDPPTVTNRCD